MADKLEQGVSVVTTFVDGETPTAAKLNSISSQMKNATQQLERAVGDIHGQSFPYSSTSTETLTTPYGRTDGGALTGAESRSLDIANLARLIGPASALNPALLGSNIEITEDVPNSVNEFSLRYPPKPSTAISFTKNGAGEAFTRSKSTKADLALPGDYYVDSLGRVFTCRQTDGADAGTVTYTINRTEFNGGASYEGSRFNVFPGPNQLSAGGNGCTVGSPDAQGRRQVTIPAISHAQYNEDMDSVSLDDADPNYQETPALPAVLVDNYSAGELIPQGFLILKNWSTGEVYEDADHYYNDRTSILVGGVDLATEVTRGDKFCIITVGTDITTSIDDLRRKMRHGHDRSFGEPLVPASAITDWTAGPWGTEGSFTASEISSNYAPQYLHRYGYQVGECLYNDANAMRGHLVLGLDGASPGSYLATAGSPSVLDTYKLSLGHPVNTWLRVIGGTNEFEIKNNVAGSISIEQVGGSIDLTAGGAINTTSSGLNLTSTGTVEFDFEDEQFTHTSYRSTYDIGEQTGSAGNSFVQFNVANTGNAGNDGWFQVGGRGFSFIYDDETIPGSITHQVPGSAQAYFNLDAGAGQGAFFVENNNPSGTRLLELYFEQTPSDAEYYVRFTGLDSGPSYDIFGSIRGSDGTTDDVFYSEFGATTFTARAVGISGRVPNQDPGHVKYVSGGADYGEWIEAGDPDEWEPYFKVINRRSNRLGLPEGLVVYVREGKFWMKPGGTPMIITNRAIVVGNENSRIDVSNAEVLSFIGQVPVYCEGPCKDGDLLIPHPVEVSAVMAIDPDEITFNQYREAIGTAWSASEQEEGISKVLCAVGKK